MKDSVRDFVLTGGSHTVFVQILRGNVNLTIIPLQGVGNDIVAELGDNRTEIKDAVGSIIEDNLYSGSPSSSLLV